MILLPTRLPRGWHGDLRPCVQRTGEEWTTISNSFAVDVACIDYFLHSLSRAQNLKQLRVWGCQRELHGSLQCHVHIHACQLYCDLRQLVGSRSNHCKVKQWALATACRRLEANNIDTWAPDCIVTRNKGRIVHTFISGYGILHLSYIMFCIYLFLLYGKYFISYHFVCYYIIY
jgi:hypothetical protein